MANRYDGLRNTDRYTLLVVQFGSWTVLRQGVHAKSSRSSAEFTNLAADKKHVCFSWALASGHPYLKGLQGLSDL